MKIWWAILSSVSSHHRQSFWLFLTDCRHACDYYTERVRNACLLLRCSLRLLGMLSYDLTTNKHRPRNKTKYDTIYDLSLLSVDLFLSTNAISVYQWLGWEILCTMVLYRASIVSKLKTNRSRWRAAKHTTPAAWRTTNFWSDF